MDSLKPVIDTLDGVIANLDSALSTTAMSDTPATPATPATSAASTDPPVADTTSATPVTSATAADGTPVADGAAPTDGQQQKKKKKKEKKPKPPAPPPLPTEATQFHQCDLRVGRVVSVAPHPEADGLYALKIAYASNATPEQTRSVCAGLRKFIPEEAMSNRLVVTICNLKPRKLRGIDSEAMILAGSVVSGEGEKETVVPLAAPEGAVEGDCVGVEGLPGERTVVEGKFVSGKVWDKVVPRLSVKDGLACYDGSLMVAGGKPVGCDLPDGAEIH